MKRSHFQRNGGDPTEPMPDHDIEDDGDFDGCLHGVPWCDPCYECELEDEATWTECGYY